jgi:hypothetical protein
MSESATADAPRQVEAQHKMVAVTAEEIRSFRGVAEVIGARVVRDWVRAQLIPAALTRLYNIGMGTQKFTIATEKGGLVDVEAFASVQVEALSKLVDLGVPRQLGLVDSDGEDLPGVIALGVLELDEVQRDQHSERFPQLKRLGEGDGVEVAADDESQTGISDIGDVMLSPSVRSGGYEIVEVPQEAMIAKDGEKPGEVPPPPLSTEPTLAQQILAKRRRDRELGHLKRSDNGDG